VLKDMKFQACQAFSVPQQFIGLTAGQAVCIAQKVISGTGTTVSPPDCGLASSVTASPPELTAVLDALNSNYDECDTDLGCLVR
jgi:hypothetical protein